jgi:hypothetical protein
MMTKKAEQLIDALRRNGYEAMYGGGRKSKGHGFWIKNLATGQTLENDGVKSGNPYFFMFDDAKKLIDNLPL